MFATNNALDNEKQGQRTSGHQWNTQVNHVSPAQIPAEQMRLPPISSAFQLQRPASSAISSLSLRRSGTRILLNPSIAGIITCSLGCADRRDRGRRQGSGDRGRRRGRSRRRRRGRRQGQAGDDSVRDQDRLHPEGSDQRHASARSVTRDASPESRPSPPTFTSSGRRRGGEEKYVPRPTVRTCRVGVVPANLRPVAKAIAVLVDLIREMIIQ